MSGQNEQHGWRKRNRKHVTLPHPFAKGPHRVLKATAFSRFVLKLS